MKTSPIIIATLSLLAAVRGVAAEPVVKPQMTGKWEGEGKIIVTWCKQKTLEVTIEIGKDGKASGKVGDATFEGTVRRNRGALGRALKIKTDYIIVGKLKGQIVAAEGIRRSEVKMPLNFTKPGYSGGLHTSGPKAGSAKKMRLSVADLNLRKQG